MVCPFTIVTAKDADHDPAAVDEAVGMVLVTE